MNLCDKCLHNNVCGEEAFFEGGVTYCADFIEKPNYWIGNFVYVENMPFEVVAVYFHKDKKPKFIAKHKNMTTSFYENRKEKLE